VQATAAGLAIAFGGIVRDVIAAVSAFAAHGPAGPFMAVYALEIVALAVALALVVPLLGWRREAAATGQATA
jgi:BCD family chlorophyll transporter-like MFS transporter